MDEAGPGLFPLGRRIVSRNALAVLGEARAEPNRLFDRHAARDWGDRGQELVPEQDGAVDSGYGCVTSAYVVLGDVRVVVLTQPDRSNTVMALPDEIERLQKEGRSSSR